MAVHYYDEDNIDIGKPVNGNIVVNHAIELTEEEKTKARREAIQRFHNEAYSNLKRKKNKAVNQTQNQASLFDF